MLRPFTATRRLSVCLACALLVAAPGCISKSRPASPTPSPSGAGSTTPTPPSASTAVDYQLGGGEALANGVTGCWVLPGGSVLLESATKDGQQYSCLLPAENRIEQVTPAAWNCILRDIRADSVVFIRRHNPTGSSPDIVTVSVTTLELISAQAVQSSADLAVSVAKQPKAAPDREPAPPKEWLVWPSEDFETGVSACWLLPDGTILLAGPRQIVMFRYYPKHNQTAFVSSDALMATVMDITDSSVKLLCHANSPTALELFPYIITYDLMTSERGKPETVFLPVTAPVTIGWISNHNTELKDIAVQGDSLSVVTDDEMFDVWAEYAIRCMPEEHLLVIDMPGARARDLRLPLVIDGTQGLIRSALVETIAPDDASAGVTITLSLDEAKWDDLTYNCELGWHADDYDRTFRLTVYDERIPTDITAKVGP